MKKKNTSTIIATIAIIAFIVGGFYLMSRGNGGSQVVDSAIPAGTFNDLVGKPAPAFSLKDRNGAAYSNDILKGKNVVFFFNEGIMCYPACWNQMVSLATDPRFNNADAAAFSVVIDNPDDWRSAVAKMPELGKARVLFDTDKAASNIFGMLAVPSSMHHGSYPGHTFVVIDKEGIVRSVFDDPNMGIDNDRVFAELQNMK